MIGALADAELALKDADESETEVFTFVIGVAKDIIARKESRERISLGAARAAPETEAPRSCPAQPLPSALAGAPGLA